jgi:hypothetical protein
VDFNRLFFNFDLWEFFPFRPLASVACDPMLFCLFKKPHVILSRRVRLQEEVGELESQ